MNAYKAFKIMDYVEKVKYTVLYLINMHPFCGCRRTEPRCLMKLWIMSSS